jgi:hypothetical protein
MSRFKHALAVRCGSTLLAYLVALGLVSLAITMTWEHSLATTARPSVIHASARPSSSAVTLAGSQPIDAEGVMAGVGVVRETLLQTTRIYSNHLFLPVMLQIYWPTLPDLTTMHVSFDSPNVVAGQPFQFSVLVSNHGAADTSHSIAPDWFTVEVYFKDRSFSPSGPPADPLDHAGGYCSDASVNCATGAQRPDHVAFLSNLEPGKSHEVRFVLTFPSSDLYDVYVQVDTTWPAQGYTGQPWGQHFEEQEQNNIFAIEDFYVPPAR